MLYGKVLGCMLGLVRMKSRPLLPLLPAEASCLFPIVKMAVPGMTQSPHGVACPCATGLVHFLGDYGLAGGRPEIAKR